MLDFLEKGNLSCDDVRRLSLTILPDEFEAICFVREAVTEKWQRENGLDQPSWVKEEQGE
jgi:hypothetical protein